MSHLTPTFHARAEEIHREHEIIAQTLVDLEVHLGRMAAHPQSREHAGEVCRAARELDRVLPAHCRREEQELHDVVADISPQLEEFTRVMKQQHQVLMARLNVYLMTVNACEVLGPTELHEHLVDEGKALVRAIQRHVAVEERELSGFF